MTTIEMEQKRRETFLSGLAAVLVMAIILTLLVITGYLIA
jgi:hypothetical protein